MDVDYINERCAMHFPTPNFPPQHLQDTPPAPSVTPIHAPIDNHRDRERGQVDNIEKLH
ncbi:hypothetical protein H2248_011016 [Termitomyces sp. 'cryptogamus']|nr:hypothetical protein H2248_011016 [Termitomyces sp. 'cryptogamus']